MFRASHLYVVNMRQRAPYRVEEEAALAAFTARARQFAASPDAWAAGNDSEVDPQLEAAQAALRDLREDPYAYPRDLAAASERLHRVCLARAQVLAAARQSLLRYVRAVAARIQSDHANRTTWINLRAMRTIAALTGRLHGLIHVCLVAARVNTPKPASVPSLC